MLTPAATDPKRKEELKRREVEPTAFGTNDLTVMPKDWNPGGGIAIIKGQEQAPQQAKQSNQNVGAKTGNHKR